MGEEERVASTRGLPKYGWPGVKQASKQAKQTLGLQE